MMTDSADILVITPHPDDAEYGVAGTVVQWVREGKTVVYAVCTNGDKGTDDPDMDPKEIAAIREDEQIAASKVLGVREVVFLRLPDQELEDTPAFRKEIVRLIRKYKPEIVVTADPYRRYIWHRDHRITGQVVLDAAFPYARDVHSYPDLTKEGLLPHKVKEVWLWAAEDVNHRVDIANTFDVKVSALLCHQSQVQQFTTPEGMERLRDGYKRLGEPEGLLFAESFHRVEIRW